MGIPRLTTHIQPYLIPTVLGCSIPDCETPSHPQGAQQKLIIDGPGLAYYLYYRLLAHKPDSLNGLDALPSYNELGRATLIFLDELQNRHVIIEKVYFDGYLPLWKRDIRLSRLERNRQDVLNLHSITSKGFAVSGTTSETYQVKASDLFDTSRPLPSNLKGIPAPPFMVPAILDAISNSKYAAVTEVVPDEADPYCARAAKESGGIILTSDSDLLVYDLGEFGAVAFFSSLELRTGTGSSSCETIEAAVCRPRDLARQLALENVQRLAFEIREDPSITFLTALGLARLPESKPTELKAFLDQYQTDPSTINSPNVPPTLPTDSTIEKQFLDPQTSEFLLQATSNPQQNLCFYLPTLLDSPPKTSAWTPSNPLRFLTYSYALASSPHQPHSVGKYSRKGSRIIPSSIPLLSTLQLISSATALLARIKALRTLFPDVPTTIAWRLFALHEILTWCSDVDKSPPSRTICTRVLTGTTTAAEMWTWEDLHLSAQIQGVLYSLRMLKQTLVNIPSMNIFTTPSSFQSLLVVLHELPPLAQLLPSRLELAVQVPRGFDVGRVLDAMAGMLRTQSEDGDGALRENVVETPEWEEQKRKKRSGKGKGKGKGRKREGGERGVKPVGGENLFSMLEYA